jgi:hypothetical protein
LTALRTILFLLLLACISANNANAQQTPGKLDFFGETVLVPSAYKAPIFKRPLSAESLQSFQHSLDTASLRPYLHVLLQYKAAHDPGDWLYYQLVRRVAQAISPKAEDYHRYTFYKWWFLTQSGYDARLTISDSLLLFYVQSNEMVYNIPYRMLDGKQYVCLNYHDYGAIDFSKHVFNDVTPAVALNAKPFSYKVARLPDFSQADYTDKAIAYSDGLNAYSFRIKVNPQIKTLFSNYPVLDYDVQFNMPLSQTTYQSLIPALRKQLKGLRLSDGVEFLMHFTRSAFLFKPDSEVFGGEKRMTPEQTLLYESSDCEDRAALFYFLVKEIYNLPMLVLTYPQHVTVAVQFDKPVGKTIDYNGSKYSICEPSPQRMDLGIGQTLPELKKQPYEVAYAYQPSGK